MASIKELKNSIVLENDYAEITLSKKDSLVEKVIDKKAKKDIQGEETRFFNLFTKELEEVAVCGISLKGNVISVDTEKGAFDVMVYTFDSYFAFEVISKIPEGIYKMHFVHVKYDYDYVDKKNTGAILIPLTIWADPVHFPDAKAKETYSRVFPHLGDVKAKIALIIAPIIEHRDIIKEASLTIDKSCGIVSKTGGAWSNDYKANFLNYTIVTDSSYEFLENNLPYFKEIGIDQLDFHIAYNNFRQGDFKVLRYKDTKDFNQRAIGKLKEYGMTASLHSFSFYVAYNCDTLLSRPDYQKQLKVYNTYTLAEDINEDTDFIKIVESPDLIAPSSNACQKSSPVMLIGEELIKFEIKIDGLKVTQRGLAGTKPASHKKGDVLNHIEGYYYALVPQFGSELFLEVARNTAKMYNEGGFNMIYLDAIDGIHYHCDRGNEDWFYMAQFVCEVLKNCNSDPIIESASTTASIWAVKGRTGAWDSATRGYKIWNNKHANANKLAMDRHLTPMLGWYHFYPLRDDAPANEHTRIHYPDAIEHMGSIAIMHDFSNVIKGNKPLYERYAGLKRNINLYKKYDDLRKSEYFSKEYRQKLIDGPWEYHLKEKRGRKWIFVEKDYQIAKLQDLSDTERNYKEFKNPFGAQVPFIRLEAMHSTLRRNPMVMMKLDENTDLVAQKLEVQYGQELNFINNRAKVVKVKGNGIKGGKIAINLRSATNSVTTFGEYIIDTDFEGWRDFILVETDNGERNDHSFEKDITPFKVHLAYLNHDRLTGVDIKTEGDMTGVKMSSILAYELTYEVYKNPTVRIGDSWIQFECELLSGEYIEWDGKNAKAIDRYGNERAIYFSMDNFKVPRGKFKASVEARALNRTTPRMQLTLGFTGKEVK